ncbi:hypothetical protein [Tenacibaculum sp. 190524A02b]|uniref:hypothetical protein n=1 Tax=Tenacibaculum vairaonense TaxID=3137860 RepID=UPI0031FAC25C
MMKSVRIDINTAMSICIRNGVKVFPVVKGRGFVINVEDNGKIIEYDKLVDSSKVATAMTKVYKHFALKIKQGNDA